MAILIDGGSGYRSSTSTSLARKRLRLARLRALRRAEAEAKARAEAIALKQRRAKVAAARRRLDARKALAAEVARKQARATKRAAIEEQARLRQKAAQKAELLARAQSDAKRAAAKKAAIAAKKAADKAALQARVQSDARRAAELRAKAAMEAAKARRLAKVEAMGEANLAFEKNTAKKKAAAKARLEATRARKAAELAASQAEYQSRLVQKTTKPGVGQPAMADLIDAPGFARPPKSAEPRERPTWELEAEVRASRVRNMIEWRHEFAAAKAQQNSFLTLMRTTPGNARQYQQSLWAAQAYERYLRLRRVQLDPTTGSPSDAYKPALTSIDNSLSAHQAEQRIEELTRQARSGQRYSATEMDNLMTLYDQWSDRTTNEVVLLGRKLDEAVESGDNKRVQELYAEGSGTIREFRRLMGRPDGTEEGQVNNVKRLYNDWAQAHNARVTAAAFTGEPSEAAMGRIRQQDILFARWRKQGKGDETFIQYLERLDRERRENLRASWAREQRKARQWNETMGAAEGMIMSYGAPRPGIQPRWNAVPDPSAPGNWPIMRVAQGMQRYGMTNRDLDNPRNVEKLIGLLMQEWDEGEGREWFRLFQQQRGYLPFDRHRAGTDINSVHLTRRAGYENQLRQVFGMDKKGDLETMMQSPFGWLLDAINVPVSFVGSAVRDWAHREGGELVGPRMNWEGFNPATVPIQMIAGLLQGRPWQEVVADVAGNGRPIIEWRGHVDKSPEAKARADAFQQHYQQQAAEAHAGGELRHQMQVYGEYGSQPFSADSDLGTVLFWVVADPLNFIPINAATWLARGRHALKTTRGTNMALRVPKATWKWLRVSDRELRAGANETLQRLQKQIDDQGLALGDAQRLVDEVLAGVDDASQVDEVLEARSRKWGVIQTKRDFRQLSRVIQQKAIDRAQARGYKVTSQFEEAEAATKNADNARDLARKRARQRDMAARSRRRLARKRARETGEEKVKKWRGGRAEPIPTKPRSAAERVAGRERPPAPKPRPAEEEVITNPRPPRATRQAAIRAHARASRRKHVRADPDSSPPIPQDNPGSVLYRNNPIVIDHLNDLVVKGKIKAAEVVQQVRTRHSARSIGPARISGQLPPPRPSKNPRYEQNAYSALIAGSSNPRIRAMEARIADRVRRRLAERGPREKGYGFSPTGKWKDEPFVHDLIEKARAGDLEAQVRLRSLADLEGWARMAKDQNHVPRGNRKPGRAPTRTERMRQAGVRNAADEKRVEELFTALAYAGKAIRLGKKGKELQEEVLRQADELTAWPSTEAVGRSIRAYVKSGGKGFAFRQFSGLRSLDDLPLKRHVKTTRKLAAEPLNPRKMARFFQSLNEVLAASDDLAEGYGMAGRMLFEVFHRWNRDGRIADIANVHDAIVRRFGDESPGADRLMEAMWLVMESRAGLLGAGAWDPDVAEAVFREALEGSGFDPALFLAQIPAGYFAQNLALRTRLSPLLEGLDARLAEQGIPPKMRALLTGPSFAGMAEKTVAQRLPDLFLASGDEAMAEAISVTRYVADEHGFLWGAPTIRARLQDLEVWHASDGFRQTGEIEPWMEDAISEAAERFAADSIAETMDAGLSFAPGLAEKLMSRFAEEARQEFLRFAKLPFGAKVNKRFISIPWQVREVFDQMYWKGQVTHGRPMGHVVSYLLRLQNDLPRGSLVATTNVFLRHMERAGALAEGRKLVALLHPKLIQGLKSQVMETGGGLKYQQAALLKRMGQYPTRAQHAAAKQAGREALDRIKWVNDGEDAGRGTVREEFVEDRGTPREIVRGYGDDTALADDVTRITSATELVASKDLINAASDAVTYGDVATVFQRMTSLHSMGDLPSAWTEFSQWFRRLPRYQRRNVYKVLQDRLDPAEQQAFRRMVQPKRVEGQAQRVATAKAAAEAKREAGRAADEAPAGVAEGSPLSTPEFWVKQTAKYPKKGSPGMETVKGDDGVTIIARDADGSLVGVLRMSDDAGDFADEIAYGRQSGDITAEDVITDREVLVRPDARRQGWASRMYDYAEAQGYDIRTFSGTRATDEGAAFSRAYRSRPAAAAPEAGRDWSTATPAELNRAGYNVHGEHTTFRVMGPDGTVLVRGLASKDEGWDFVRNRLAGERRPDPVAEAVVDDAVSAARETMTWADVRAARLDLVDLRRAQKRFSKGTPEWKEISERIRITAGALNYMEDVLRVPVQSMKKRKRWAERVVRRKGKEMGNIVPHGMIGWYVAEPGMAKIERVRRYQRWHQTANVEGNLAPAVKARIDKIIPHFDEIEEYISARVRAVQGPRRALLDRRLDFEADGSDRVAGALRDDNPAVIAAKKQAIRELNARFGIKLDIGLYDELRTGLRKPLVQQRETERLAQEALARVAAEGGTYREHFLELRAQRAADEGAKQLYWHAKTDLYGWSADDAVEELSRRWTDSGHLKHAELRVSAVRHYAWGAMVKHLSGADVADDLAMREVLSINRPADLITNRGNLKRFLQENGYWNVRTREQFEAEARHWTMDEAADWFWKEYRAVPNYYNDEYLEVNGYFKELGQHRRLTREFGDFDERAMVDRKLRGINLIQAAKELVRGVPERGIRPMRSFDAERRYAIETYGTRVADPATGMFKPDRMPWLWNREEMRANLAPTLAARAARETTLIGSKKELEDLERVADVVMDEMELRGHALVAEDGSIAYEHVNEFAMLVGARLMQDLDWLPLLVRRGGPSRIIAWTGQFQRSLVMTTVAFAGINSVDTLAKVAFWRMTHWKTMFKTQARAMAYKWIASNSDYGGSSVSQFMFEFGRVDPFKRLSPRHRKLSRANRDTGDALLGLVRDTVPYYAARGEDVARLNIARDIFTDLWDDVYKATLKETKVKLNRALKPDEMEAVEALAASKTKLLVRDEVEKLFPSLNRAGHAEHVLNEFFPFFSYTIKNKLLWIREFANHPAWLNRIDLAASQIEKDNREKWEQEHPDSEIPPWLARQIELPWAKGHYIDLSMFSDATRGLAILSGREKTWGQAIDEWFNFVNPATQALVRSVTDPARITGRWAWQAGMEDGRYTGKWERVWVPDGEPWSGMPVGPHSIFWPFEIGRMFNELNADGLDLTDITRLAHRLLFYGDLGRFNPHQLLSDSYFALKEKGLDAQARSFFKTHETDLKAYWMANGTAPQDHMVPSWLTGDWESITSEALYGRAWYGQQTFEFRKAVREAITEKIDIQDNFAWRIEQAVLDGDFEKASELRRMQRQLILELYQRSPELVKYEVHRQTPTEWAETLEDWRTDELTDRFFDLLSERPTKREDETWPEYRTRMNAWQRKRDFYLENWPTVADRFRGSVDSVAVARERQDEIWGEAFGRMTRLNEELAEAKAMEDYERSDAIYLLKDLDAQLLETDVWAYVTPGEFRGGVTPVPGQFVPLGDFQQKITGRMTPEELADYEEGRKYATGMKEVIAAAKAGGKFDPAAFVRALKANPWLLEQYFLRNPGKRAEWAANEEYISLIGRFGRLAAAGKLDRAMDYFEGLPKWVKERYYNKHPEKRARHAYANWWEGFHDLMGAGREEKAFDYYYSMPKWVQRMYGKFKPRGSGGSAYAEWWGGFHRLMDNGKRQRAFDYYEKMPPWVQKRYFRENPEKAQEFRENRAYLGWWEKFHRMMDSGKREAAFDYYAAMPGWVRQRYGKFNPGKKREFEQGSRYMGWWNQYFRLHRQGKRDQAFEYFEQMPDWVRERYYKANPEKRREHERQQAYANWWDRYHSLLDAGKNDQAQRYINGMPGWVRTTWERNNPGKAQRFARNERYIGWWKGYFELKDSGNAAGADKYIDSMPDWVRRQWEENNPGKARRSKQNEAYVGWWGRYHDLKKAGKEAAADRYIDSMPDWVRQRWAANNPGKARRFQQNEAYLGWWDGYFDLKKAGKDAAARKYIDGMPAWVRQKWGKNMEEQAQKAGSPRMDRYVQWWDRYFDLHKTGNKERAFAYYNRMPDWVKDIYYKANPKAKERAQQNLVYMGHMEKWTSFFERGDFEGGMAYFDSMPPWVRERYYAKHPEKRRDDAQNNQYMKLMDRWVKLYKAGKREEAEEFFRSLPQWAQDRYLKKHPEKFMLAEDGRMMARLQQYFLADEAHRAAFIRDNPDVAEFVNSHSSEAQRIAMITAVYKNLPKDAWVQRTFREMYPEVFSVEARGARTAEKRWREADERGLTDEMVAWVEGLVKSAGIAAAFARKPPKPMEVKRKRRRRKHSNTYSARDLDRMAA